MHSIKYALILTAVGFLFPSATHAKRLCQNISKAAVHREVKNSWNIPPDHSVASISISEGAAVNFYSAIGGKSQTEARQVLSPENPIAVIGRMEGEAPPYLDKKFIATQIMPGGGRAVKYSDTMVSRAHFMLKYHPEGILIVNGVPREGGGIRAPIHGTQLLSPENRSMKDGEAHLVEKGKSAKIRLPGGTVLLINAE